MLKEPVCPQSSTPTLGTHTLVFLFAARYQIDVGGSLFAAVAYYHHAIALDSTQGQSVVGDSVRN